MHWVWMQSSSCSHCSHFTPTALTLLQLSSNIRRDLQHSILIRRTFSLQPAIQETLERVNTSTDGEDDVKRLRAVSLHLMLQVPNVSSKPKIPGNKSNLFTQHPAKACSTGSSARLSAVFPIAKRLLSPPRNTLFEDS